MQLVSFTATPVNESVELVWNVATELNNDYFVVERSSTGTQFLPVTTVPGAGTSTNAKRYIAHDNEPLPGTAYYRLAQVDFDGKRTDLHVVRVDLNSSQAENIIAYPNPLERSAVLTLEYKALRDEELNVSISTALGERLENHRTAVKGGFNELQLSPAWKEAGIYFVTVQSTSQLRTIKIIVY